MQQYLRERKRLTFENGILYRNAYHDGEQVKQLVITFPHRARAL